MTALRIRAGATALQHIRENGLSPEHISAVFGASGAAKWLGIYGLDCAIFGDWLSQSQQPVDLFGTSIGAFKLAAAARNDPREAMTVLAHAYTQQQYDKNMTTDELGARIALETNRILDTFLPAEGINEILSNSRYHFHCGSVRCKGWLASQNVSKQKVAMARGLLLSAFGRGFYHAMVERVIFSKGTSVLTYSGRDGINTQIIKLTPDNFRDAILSSGSIPVVMPSVENITGAPDGVYRDGGLLDYHPVPSNVTTVNNGLALYPHFYSQLKEGWFDKYWSWRTVRAEQLDRTILLSPSESFVQSLPDQRIPDRKDFYRFRDNDSKRVENWNTAIERSLELGEEFLQLCRSGNVADRAEPI